MSRNAARKIAPKPAPKPAQERAEWQPSPPSDKRRRNVYALCNAINKAARQARSSVSAEPMPSDGNWVVLAVRAAPATTTDLARAIAYAQAYSKLHTIDLQPVVFLMCKR